MPPIRTAAIVGLGLIGGSLGLGLRRAGVAQVIGVDIDPEVVSQAVARGAVDRAGTDLDLVRPAEVVIVAVPTDRIVATVAAVTPLAAGGAVVSDVGSVKAPIVRAVAVAAPGLRFVGGHPMAGSEGQGIAAASAALLPNRPYVLTPGAGTDRDAVGTMTAVAEALGMRPVVMDPQTHDRVVAEISHLPYLVAVALMQMAVDDGLAVAGPAFRDSTRVAGSPPEMWEEICTLNRTAILDALDRLQAVIGEIRQRLEAGAPVAEILRRAQSRRKQL